MTNHLLLAPTTAVCAMPEFGRRERFVSECKRATYLSVVWHRGNLAQGVRGNVGYITQTQSECSVFRKCPIGRRRGGSIICYLQCDVNYS